jgi:hypothetical protein
VARCLASPPFSVGAHASTTNKPTRARNNVFHSELGCMSTSYICCFALCSKMFLSGRSPAHGVQPVWNWSHYFRNNFYPAGWRGSNALGVHSESTGFKSEPVQSLYWLRFFESLKLGHDRLLPNPFQFIIQQSS